MQINYYHYYYYYFSPTLQSFSPLFFVMKKYFVHRENNFASFLHLSYWDSECKAELKRFDQQLSDVGLVEKKHTYLRDAYKDTMILSNGMYPIHWHSTLSHRIYTLACLRLPMHELDSEKRSQLFSRIISIHSSTSQEGVDLFFNWQQLSGMDMRRKIMNVISAK